jgi:hypothetical protein
MVVWKKLTKDDQNTEDILTMGEWEEDILLRQFVELDDISWLSSGAQAWSLILISSPRLGSEWQWSGNGGKQWGQQWGHSNGNGQWGQASRLLSCFWAREHAQKKGYRGKSSNCIHHFFLI